MGDMVDTEDTAMVDTVAREKLKLNHITEVLDTDTVPDTDSDLTDMVDTVPDTDSAMLDTAVDTDTESKHFPLQTNQRNHSIQNYAILITAKKNQCQLLLTETIRKNEREF